MSNKKKLDKKPLFICLGFISLGFVLYILLIIEKEAFNTTDYVLTVSTMIFATVTAFVMAFNHKKT